MWLDEDTSVGKSLEEFLLGVPDIVITVVSKSSEKERQNQKLELQWRVFDLMYWRRGTNGTWIKRNSSIIYFRTKIGTRGAKSDLDNSS